MAKVRVTLHSKNIDKLLKSEEIQAELERRTANAAAAAGSGFSNHVSIGRTRALGRVTADTPAAARKNRREATLLRVKDAMR